MELEINKSWEELNGIMSKLDYMENQSRRNNILVDGIADEWGENREASENKIKTMQEKNLGMNSKIMDIECAHRVGQFLQHGRPRPIIVKRFKDRQSILSVARTLKGTNIFVNEDFSDIKRRRRDLLPELKAARDGGDNASLRYDKLVIKPRGQTQAKWADSFG